MSMIKKSILLLLLFFVKIGFAAEGMWLPILLGQLNEKEMRDLGMQISAEDIYSINQSSLKDAIVLFGGGCTGEIVSDQGLLLTNHHCGYSNIQRHSTLDHDYLTDGFWAQSLREELPNPGLTVTFLVRMEDVSDRINARLNSKMTETDRENAIKKASSEIIAEAIRGTHYQASVKPFYAGNQFYLFVTETFSDVRLVGAPPSSIGKFGGDTDNWMWPRHTGDFSVFRIYASPDNQPADYSPLNVPYKPKQFLKVSLKGVKENDFTMVYGFPGSTQEYLPSYAVAMTTLEKNPIAIDYRRSRLDVIDKARNEDKLINIQYAAKSASIANYWKKMIGESRGIKTLGGIEQKQDFETDFSNWLNTNSENKEKYGDLLGAFEQTYNKLIPLNNLYTHFSEGLLSAEIIRYAWAYNVLIDPVNAGNDSLNKAKIANLSAGITPFYKNYNIEVDKKIFIATFRKCLNENEASSLPQGFATYYSKYGKDASKWAEHIYSQSIFADSVTLRTFLKSYGKKSYKKLEKDPALLMAAYIYGYMQNSILPPLRACYKTTDSLQRLYMAAQMEMQPGKRFYPDANSTLRISYGKVKSYFPYDGVKYNWFTTLDGIIEKEGAGFDDYVVAPKLKELYQAKDYDGYADTDGKMHVAFIATNHTTGGNSGSPVLDADGNLIGLNFDRCWEGTMSDLMYDPDQCRNITLDIRYCLFIIDKYAGATRLIDEMTIVRN